MVVIAVEMDGKGIGSVRMKRVPSSSGENPLGFIGDNVQKGSTVIKDGRKGYA